MFSKKDLKNGMFGVTDTEEQFVVVDSYLVYKNGAFDYVSDLSEDMSFSFRKIMKVYDNCLSFNQLERAIDSSHHGSRKPIYDRERDTPKYYSGKVVCIEVDECLYKYFTKGKVYEFKSGVGVCDIGGAITNSPVKDFDDLSRRFSYVTFIPLVE